MATPYKMKGHTLPGIKQKASPVKILGIATLTAAALAKAAAASAAAAAVTQGVGAISKKNASKKAEKLDLKNEAKKKTEESTQAISGDMGSKTKIV